jgi:phosphoribosyl 1,2-cyclic phosphodiesterase
MALTFQTLRSSSAGNCLRITCGSSTVVIDCGFRAQYECEEVLESMGPVAAVVVSHSHGDHIGQSGLRVLAKRGIPIWAHQQVLEQVWDRVDIRTWRQQPTFEPFADSAFELDCFGIQAIEVPHAPGIPNYAFVVHCGCGKACRKLVLCTDFFDFNDVIKEFADADFIYVESNHDLELLRRFPNHASRYHLSNPRTGMLLTQAIRRSRRPPQAVMLGHLSRERNREELALATVRGAFEREGLALDFPLTAAPLYRPSPVVEID